MSHANLHRELDDALGGSYRIERELGGGGMSRVFLAEETALGRRVVVKVLPPEMAAVVSADRFRREVQVAARLQHPHIVPLLAAGEAAGALWYTMPYVAGETLRTRLAREGALPAPDVVRILREVCDALGCAHRQGVVHRDVKPENVLCSEGHVLVADFGIAKALTAAATSGGAGLTTAGLVLGTPAYMAPEQAAGDPATDHRADLYAVGCLGYELLSGRPPFAGTSAQALLAAHALHAPDPPSRSRPGIPAALEAIVLRCLEKDPDARPSSAAAVVGALDGVATGAQDVTRFTSPAATTAAAAAAVRPARRGRRVALAGLAGMAMVVAGLAGAVLLDGPDAPVPSLPKSVAVLPFVNVGGDSLNEPLADGMTDELITALGRVPELRVPGRASTFAFKGHEASAQEVARRLDVGSVLEGTVRRAGDRLRVTVVLVNAIDGYQLWSQAFDGAATDIFTVQDSIARAVARALEVRLGTGSAHRFAPAATRDLVAYDLYQQGRQHFHRRGYDLERGAELFEAAVARDPGYAAAWEGLAQTYAVLPSWSRLPPAELYARAESAAARALALDSMRAGAYAAMAFAHYEHRWDLTAADSLLRRALAIAPGDGNTHQWRAMVLSAQGRHDDALEEARAALDLDPLAPIRIAWVGAVLQYAGRTREAEAMLRAGMRDHPGFIVLHRNLAMTLLMAGRAPEAVALLEDSTVDANLGGFTLGILAYARAKSGDRAGAEQLVGEIAGRVGEAGSATGLVYANVGLGRIDEAIRRARHVIRTRDAWGAFMFHDPLLAPMRADPRFADLQRGAGLQ